jgi:hypothetical protein
MPTYHPSLSARLNDLTLRAIVATKTPPPHAARILAIVHTCIYDAWACYQPKSLGTRMLGYLRRHDIQDYYKEVQEAIAHAAYRALDEYFGSLNLKDDSGNPLLTTFMLNNGYDPTITADDDFNIPAQLGNRCARAVLDYRRGDGANTFKTITLGAPSWYADYTGYKPALKHDDEPVGELIQRWQPLLNPTGVSQAFLVPHWGRVQPFAMPDGSVFRPPVPPASWDSLVLRQQAEEVIYLNANLTNEQKAICEYWLDGPASVTPPGHWMRIGEEIARRDRHDLDQDVKMFFALGNAVMDAGIAAWDCKRAYDYVRPVTLVRNWYKNTDIKGWGGPGLGTIDMKGKDWKPYQKADFVTPPFAEFVSGHSTFSTAGAYILRAFTGRDFYGGSVIISKLDIDNKDILPDVELRWPTFSNAAQQAGMSRLYGGIHFMEGNLHGQAIGEKVGQCAWEKAAALWEGTY